MEKRLMDAFDQVTMPEACAKKIEARLQTGPKTANRYTAKPMEASRHGWLAPVAAVLVLVVALGVGLPRMQQTPEQLAEVPEETTVPLETVDVQEWEFEDGAVTAIKGKIPGQGNYATGSYDTGYLPIWLSEQDGRLSFIPEGIKGDKVDITDLISTEEPYTYIYTDGDGIIHYMCVGMIHEGPFVSIAESLGFGCWFRDAAEMEAALAEGKDDFHAGWITGYASGHWNSETDTEFGWYTKAKDIMGIPWG